MESLIKYLQNIINDTNNNNLNEENIIEQFKGKSQPTIKKIINFITCNKKKITEIFLDNKQNSTERKVNFKYICNCGFETTNCCRNIDSLKFNCKKCTAQKNGASTTYTTKGFLEQLFKKYPYFTDENNWDFTNFDYNDSKGNYYCKQHNKFCSQSPGQLLQYGYFGCKICSNQGNSKEAIECLEFLSIIFNTNIIHNYNNSDGEHCLDNYNRPIDGYIENIDFNSIKEKLKNHSLEYLLENINSYLKDLNNECNKLAIEYNGTWTHGNRIKYKEDDKIIKNKIVKDVWNHDTEKYKTYNKNGYNVIVIWDTDFNKIKKTDLYKKNKDKIKEKTNTYDFSKVKKTENERKQISNNNKKRYLREDNRKKSSSTKQNNLPLNINVCNGGFDYTYTRLIYYKFSNKKLSLKYRYGCAIQIKTLVDNYLNEFNIKNKIPSEEDKELLKQKADELKKTIYDNELKKTIYDNKIDTNQKKLTNKKFVDLNKIFDTNFITIKKVYDNENNKIIGYELKKSINKINYCKKIYLKEDNSKISLNKNNRENFANTKEECIRFIKSFVYKKYIFNNLKENFII